MRKFEKVSRVENIEMIMPARKTGLSAGYDICFNAEAAGYKKGDPYCINARGVSGVLKLGIKISLSTDEYLMIVPRSSLGFKKNLMLVNTVGIIDADYYNNKDNEGEIACKFYNFGDEQQMINDGDAILQGIICKYGTVNGELENTLKNREGGIGSTGK